MTHSIIFILSCVLMHTSLWAPIVIKGNAEQENKTFNFAINNLVATNGGRTLYITAGDNGAKEFSISALPSAGAACIPIAYEKINLNNVLPGQLNPLYDKAIGLSSVLEGLGIAPDHVIAVLAADRRRIYGYGTIYPSENTASVFESSRVPDAAGNTNTVISQIVGGTTNMLTLAAVHPEGSSFGVTNSGVALLLLDLGRTGTDAEHGFFAIDAIAANPTDSSKLNTESPKALALDNTSVELCFNSNNPVAITPNSFIGMHFSNITRATYVGFSLTTGASGGTGIVLCSPKEEFTIQRVAIAPASAFDNNNNYIVGTTNSTVPITVHELSTMHVSTGLPYLIVRGGYNKTANDLFALPLVGGQTERKLNGTLASKTSPIINLVNSDSTLISRLFIEPATTPEQMTKDTDCAAIIGGGAPLPVGSTIQKTIIGGDTVFIVLTNNDATDGGVWYSRPMFDHEGRITHWSRWQRYAGVTAGAMGGSLDRDSGNCLYASTAANQTTIKRTLWSEGDASLSLPLTTIVGPTQYLTMYNQFTPGLQNIELLTALNNNRVVLAQTGSVDQMGMVIPTTGVEYGNTVTYDAGIITDNLGTPNNPMPTIITMTGGVLDTIAPLTATAIATSGEMGWICCGGLNGLAILANDNNTGWNTANGLGNRFLGLTQGMSFKILGNYTYITRLVANPPYLYVVTDTHIDRLDLSDPQDITTTTIARTSDNPFVANSTFMDFYAVEKFGLIATTNGLFRTGNGKNIATALTSNDIAWTPVPVAMQETGPAVQIVPVTANGYPFTTDHGSNLCILFADRSTNAGQINRYALKDVMNSEITGSTLLPFMDLFTINTISYWVNLGVYRDLFASDGALNFTISGQDLMVPAGLQLLPIAARSGGSILGPRAIPVASGIGGSNGIPTIMHNSSSGSWFVAANTGIRVNE